MLVLALSADSSLSAALNMMREWDVLFLLEPSQVVERSEEANVLLVGGGTAEGLRVVNELRAQGALVPAVVLGDTPADGEVPVLVPPFSLEELRSCVERTARPAPVSPIAYTDPYAYDPEDEEAGDDLESLEQAYAPSAWSEESLRGADPQPSPDAYVYSSQPEPALAPPRQVHAPAPPAASAEAARGEAPWRRMRRRRTDVGTQNLVERINAVAGSVRDLEILLDDLPVLADLEGLGNVLISEIVEKIAPETAAVYARLPGGFRAAASHGLSRAEQGMTVPATHMLINELSSKRKAVVVSPVDLSQGLVVGIGGAHTHAVAAAPIEVDGRTIGFVLAGAARFSDRDVSTLENLAREAAPGIAIAQLCARLRL